MLSRTCSKLCHVSSIDQVWESNWRLFTKVCQDTIDLLVKGTAHTRMKAIGGKTTVKTSATSDVGHWTKSLWQFNLGYYIVRFIVGVHVQPLK